MHVWTLLYPPYLTLPNLRAALMTVSSVFVKTPVHNGLSTTPIEFRVVQEHSRQQQQAKDEVRHSFSLRS